MFETKNKDNFFGGVGGGAISGIKVCMHYLVKIVGFL
jgi:hypothetical protein